MVAIRFISVVMRSNEVVGEEKHTHYGSRNESRRR